MLDWGFNIKRVRIGSCAAALALLGMGLGSCSKEGSSTLSTEQVKQGQAASPEAPPAEELSPEDATGCRFSSLEIVDVSSPAVVGGDSVRSVLQPLLEKRFGPFEASPQGGTVRLEYLVYRREGGEDVLFLGSRAMVRTEWGEVGLAWEVLGSAEAATPESCAKGLEAPGCVRFIEESLMPRAFGVVVQRVDLLCKLEREPADKIALALADEDSWVRLQAVKVAGERGLKQLSGKLVAALQDSDDMVVVAAIAALGRLGDASAVEALVARATKASMPVIIAVTNSLADIGTTQARAYLEEWSRNHPSEEIRERCSALLSGAP